MESFNKNEVELLIKKADKAWENADFEEAYKLFKKIVKLTPKNPRTIILFSICASSVGIYDYYKSAQQIFENLKKAVDCGLMELSNEMIEELIGAVVIYCIQTNKVLHEKCQKEKISHKFLVEYIRAIESNVTILEYIVDMLEKKNKESVGLIRTYYIDSLKEISLRFSKMFGKYHCSDCNGLCAATEWSYSGDLNESFNKVNAKILKIDPTYKTPKKAKKISKFSVSMRKFFRNEKKYCDKCNKKFTINELLSYQVPTYKTDEHSVSAIVLLMLKCEDCHEIVCRQVKLEVKRIDSNGWVREYSLEEKIQDYLN